MGWCTSVKNTPFVDRIDSWQDSQNKVYITIIITEATVMFSRNTPTDCGVKGAWYGMYIQ